jgi:ABC-2 type transport system ATP-binding protein
MDEPAANLDPKARSEFFNMLLKLKQLGKAVLISSHILAEIDKYADSATILDGGKIVFSGTKQELNKLFAKKE